MANHKSAVKRHKQSEQRRQRNITVKSTLRTAVKKVKDAVGGGNAEEAKTSLKKAVVLMDKAVTKNVLHRNNASRKISRLTASVNKLQSK